MSKRSSDLSALCADLGLEKLDLEEAAAVETTRIREKAELLYRDVLEAIAKERALIKSKKSAAEEELKKKVAAVANTSTVRRICL